MTALAAILPSFDAPAVRKESLRIGSVTPAADHGPRGMGFVVWMRYPNCPADVFQIVETRAQADEVLSRKQRIVRLTKSSAVFWAAPYADQIVE